ncbi:MAG: hypothetical protein AMXMBFR55_29870 [Gemmatimonadota bacterium]
MGGEERAEDEEELSHGGRKVVRGEGRGEGGWGRREGSRRGMGEAADRWAGIVRKRP